MVLCCLFFYMIYRQRLIYRIQPLRLVVLLAGSNFLFHLFLQLCKGYEHDKRVHRIPPHAFSDWNFPVYWGQFLFRLTNRYLTLAVVGHYWLIARQGYRQIAPLPLCTVLLAVLGLVILECGTGMAVNMTAMHNQTMHMAPFAENYAISCWFREKTQVYYALVSNFFTAVAHIGLMMAVARLDSSRYREGERCRHSRDLRYSGTGSQTQHEHLLPWQESAGRDSALASSRESNLEADRLGRLGVEEVVEELLESSEQELLTREWGGKEEMDAYCGLKYSMRIKILAAFAVLRLMLQIGLEISMMSAGGPDGSFYQLLLLTVVLVDGEGGITALIFMVNNPHLGEALLHMMPEGFSHDSETFGTTYRRKGSVTSLDEFRPRRVAARLSENDAHGLSFHRSAQVPRRATEGPRPRAKMSDVSDLEGKVARAQSTAQMSPVRSTKF